MSNYDYEIRKMEKGGGFEIVRHPNVNNARISVIHRFISTHAEAVVKMLCMYDADRFWRLELGFLYDQVRFGTMSDDELVNFVADRSKQDDAAMIKADRMARRLRANKYPTKQERSDFSREMRPYDLREMAYGSSMSGDEFEQAVLKAMGLDAGGVERTLQGSGRGDGAR